MCILMCIYICIFKLHLCISYLNVLTTCFLRESNRQFEEAEISSCQHLIRTYWLASQIGCGMVWTVVTSKLDYHILSLTFALCRSQVLHGVASAQPGLPLGLSRASCFRAQEGAAKWSKFWVFLKQLGTDIFACLGEIMDRTLEHMDFPIQVENILWLSCGSRNVRWWLGWLGISCVVVLWATMPSHAWYDNTMVGSVYTIWNAHTSSYLYNSNYISLIP